MSSTLPHRVLVVDDEPAVAEALRMMLEFDGYEVHTCDEAKAALELFGQSKFDVVITDYSMPLMKGDQFAAAIKSTAPHCPVIMVTAYAEMLKASGNSLPGVDSLISKPFLMENLREAMARVLPALARPVDSAKA